MTERPLECSQCKKCVDVLYTEMIQGTAITVEMCHDCPILKQKLEGRKGSEKLLKKEEGIYCGHCHTSLESVLMGEPLGCQECYHIFQDVLVDQLRETQCISPRLKQTSAGPTATFHMGKTPFIGKNPEDVHKLRDLNEALSEALKGENYEEAAWIRDQINSLSQGNQ